MTLSEVNALDRQAFVDAVGWVFEHSPWVAERAWSKRPFLSLDGLRATLLDEALAGSRDEQLALLRAHPDLGTRARMTQSSTREQRGAGLDQLTPDQFERLQRLNAAYREKFGFPFLYAVKGSSVDQILSALESRAKSGHEQEFVEAMRQVGRIAGFRLESIIENSEF